MSLERLNAIESELGIKKEQPSLPRQSSIPTSIDTTISPSKPKSRLDEIEQELFQTKVTNTTSQNPTFKDNFVNDMEPSSPPEVNNKYAYAFKLGLADTFRGVKQMAGRDKEEMKAEQQKLNELMRGEDGGLVTLAYFGGALLDPASWLIPFGKAKTLYTMGKYGMVSGAVAGATGYVDDESIIDTRGKQLLAGAVGGGIVAPAIGGLRNLGVKITGKGEVTPVGFKRANLTPAETIKRGGSTVQVKGKAIEEDLSEGKIYSEGERTLGVRTEGEIGKEPKSIFDTLVDIFRKQDTRVPFPKTKKVLDAPKQGELSGKPHFFINKILKGYEENYGKRFLKVATTGEGGTSIAGGLIGFNIDPEAPVFDVNAPLSSRLGRAFLGAAGGYLGVTALKKKKIKTVYGKDTDEPVEITESLAEVLGRQIIDKYGLTKDYKKLLQKYDGTKNDIASAFVRIAKQMQKLTKDERKILYNMLEGDIKNDIPSDKLKELSKMARDLITDTGQMYVDLGLLAPQTFKKNRDRYLGRLYQKDDDVPFELKKIGDDLKPRGTLHEVTVGDWFMTYKNQKPTINDIVDPDHKGWELLGDFEEIGGQLYQVTKRQKPTVTDERLGKKGKILQKKLLKRDEMVPIRWELTKEQRLAKGEIEDAAISMEYTGILMAQTVAKYQFYADVAAQFAEEAGGRTAQQMLALPQRYRKIPENKISGTVSKKYGALAGKYVPENVYKDIMGTRRYQEKSSNAVYAKYKKLNSLWKVSKTAWNPTVHVNNVFGNIVLSDLADVPIRTLPKAFRALRTHGKEGHRSEIVLLAIKHGVFDADFVNKEIRNFKEGELAGIYKSRANADEWDNAVDISDKIYSKIRNNSITSKLEDWYRIEDHVFRLNAFMHRMKLGDSAEDAALFARRQFIDYDIDAPLINHLRNTATPFLSFTYRIIPLLAESAILRPTKYAKYIAAGYSLNKLEEIYGGEDAKVERALLPDYEAGNILDMPFMPKKVIRISGKSEDGTSKYLNISRFYPGGDILSFEGDNVVPLIPEPLQPSFGIGGDFLFSMIGYDIFRKQKEFGRGGGTALEETTKALGSFGKKLIPNFPFLPGSYSTKRLERARAGDVSKFREPQTELEALLTSFGFKVSNKSIRTLAESQKLEYERQVRVQKSKINQLKNKVAMNQISMADYDRQVGKVLAKINQLTKKYVGRFDGIDPYAMTFNFDMTKFMGRGDKATKPDKDYD